MRATAEQTKVGHYFHYIFLGNITTQNQNTIKRNRNITTRNWNITFNKSTAFWMMPEQISTTRFLQIILDCQLSCHALASAILCSLFTVLSTSRHWNPPLAWMTGAVCYKLARWDHEVVLFSEGTIHPPTTRPYGLATVKYLRNHLLNHSQILNLGLNDQIKGYTCFKWRRRLWKMTSKY